MTEDKYFHIINYFMGTSQEKLDLSPSWDKIDLIIVFISSFKFNVYRDHFQYKYSHFQAECFNKIEVSSKLDRH